MNEVPAAMRRAEILERIEREGGMTVGEVARIHAISNMTAHRDLEHLAREGLVERIRGGARAIGGRPPHPTAWDHRIAQAVEAKAAMADFAATLVTSGATVFLDASSTALALGYRLAGDPPPELTLVTNSPMIAAEIRADSIHVVVCPGELDQQTRTITGRWTTEFIGRLNFDVAFASSAGRDARSRAHHVARPDRRRAAGGARRRPPNGRAGGRLEVRASRAASRSRPWRRSTSSSATPGWTRRPRRSSAPPASSYSSSSAESRGGGGITTGLYGVCNTVLATGAPYS